MNYATQTEQLHTFADVPRVKITRHLITGQSEWDAAEKTTVQIAALSTMASSPTAVVDFHRQVSMSPVIAPGKTSNCLQRFAGAMGLEYTETSGLK